MAAPQPTPTPEIPDDTDQRSLSPLREMQLVEAWRQGDPDALSLLLEAYQRRVYGVCYRMVRNADEAADLAHDALIRMMEGLDSYDGRSKLSTWVIRVTMNLCLSHLRKQKLRRHGSLDEGRDGSGEPWSQKLQARGELSGSQRVEQAEMQAVLEEALASVEPQLRAVLVLRDIQDLNYQQIAEALDLPIGTVKSRLFRARAALRTAIEAGGPARRVGPRDD